MDVFPLNKITSKVVKKMFAGRSSSINIDAYYHIIEKKFEKYGLVSPGLQLLIYANIYAEVGKFSCISEKVNFNGKYPNSVRVPDWFKNVDPGGPQKPNFGELIRADENGYYVSNYEGKKNLGNNEIGDGFKYMGRGFIQLTGRYNYTKCGKIIGMPNLVDNPELANEPEIAAEILSAYFIDAKRKEKLQNAYKNFDIKYARRTVNSKCRGLERMAKAFWAGYFESISFPKQELKDPYLIISIIGYDVYKKWKKIIDTEIGISNFRFFDLERLDKSKGSLREFRPINII